MSSANTAISHCGDAAGGRPARGRLLGQILVDGGFVRHEEIRQALEAQKRTNRQLGQILVDMGSLDERQLRAVLDIQGFLNDPEEALRLAAGIRLKLGEMLVGTGLIGQEQLDEALAEQARTGECLGEIALRHGWLDPERLDRALRFQHAQGECRVGPAPLRLGEILVATGDITRGQLEDALARQRTSGGQLGAVLVDAGYLKPERLAHGLQLQHRLVIAALAAVLTVGGMLAAPTAQASTDKAVVTVSATVLRHVSLRVLVAPQTITITEADLARGYVDVPAPTQLEIRSNSPSGYLLSFESEADFARNIEVRGLGSTATFSRFGGVLSAPPAGARGMQVMPVTLSFRIMLSEQARAGVQPWPIQVSLLPI